MSRKHEAIDLLKLYTHGSHKGWNDFLAEKLDRRDLNAIAKVRYRICAGMDDLAKAHINDDKINVWFVRLNRSLELTAKKIVRLLHPMPTDNGGKTPFELASKTLAAKRNRDQELAKFMRESSY